MKKFAVNCDFNGQPSPFAVYIGTPERGHNPLHFQADWLGKERGGSVPPDVIEAISRLKEIAEKNKVLLEELCVYALGAAQQERDAEQGISEETDEEEYYDEEELPLTDEDFDEDEILGASDKPMKIGEEDFDDEDLKYLMEDAKDSEEDEDIDDEELEKLLKELSSDDEESKDATK